MLWKSLMKNPVLACGLLMFALFIGQVVNKDGWGFLKRDKLDTSSCRGVIVRLEKKVPANWRVSCEGNNLAVEIKEIAIPDKASNIQALMYRQLANHMAFVARTSPVDILARVMFVRFKMMHPKMDINAVTEGQYIVKLATLESPEHIMTHLKATVHVKETIK